MRGQVTIISTIIDASFSPLTFPPPPPPTSAALPPGRLSNPSKVVRFDSVTKVNVPTTDRATDLATDRVALLAIQEQISPKGDDGNVREKNSWISGGVINVKGPVSVRNLRWAHGKETIER